MLAKIRLALTSFLELLQAFRCLLAFSFSRLLIHCLRSLLFVRLAFLSSTLIGMSPLLFQWSSQVCPFPILRIETSTIVGLRYKHQKNICHFYFYLSTECMILESYHYRNFILLTAVKKILLRYVRRKNNCVQELQKHIRSIRRQISRNNFHWIVDDFYMTIFLGIFSEFLLLIGWIKESVG